MPLYVPIPFKGRLSAPLKRIISLSAQYEREPRPEEGTDWAGRPSRFYFDVETVGSLKPEEVVTKVLQLPIAKADPSDVFIMNRYIRGWILSF